MQKITELYSQLFSISNRDFYQLESEFFMHFLDWPNEKKSRPVVAFQTISNWNAASLRSGVWTFYEVADKKDLNSTFEYLRETEQKEFASIFESGIHDYQSVENMDYPDEWIEQADLIDEWITEHEDWLIGWKRNLLMENKKLICE